MIHRSRDLRYCYHCEETTEHIRGGEFTEWVCDSAKCKYRRARIKELEKEKQEEKQP